jgi:hypothetical protein
MLCLGSTAHRPLRLTAHKPPNSSCGAGATHSHIGSPHLRLRFVYRRNRFQQIVVPHCAIHYHAPQLLPPPSSPLRHSVLVVCCALLCLTAIMSRAHRGSTTPMDFEWSNKHGPVDQRSPFMTAVDAAQHARKREYPRLCPSLLPPLTSMARPSLCPRLPQAPRRRLHNTQPSPAARTRRPQLSLRSRLDPPIALIHSRTRPERLDAAHPDHRLRFQLRR